MADNDGPYPCPQCHGEGRLVFPSTETKESAICNCSGGCGTGQAEKPPQTRFSGSFVKIRMEGAGHG